MVAGHLSLRRLSINMIDFLCWWTNGVPRNTVWEQAPVCLGSNYSNICTIRAARHSLLWNGWKAEFLAVDYMSIPWSAELSRNTGKHCLASIQENNFVWYIYKTVNDWRQMGVATKTLNKNIYYMLLYKVEITDYVYIVFLFMYKFVASTCCH